MKQAVAINGLNSNRTPIFSGGPKDSVLEPILLFAYTLLLDDVLYHEVKSRERLFADDTVMKLSLSLRSESQVLKKGHTQPRAMGKEPYVNEYHYLTSS